MSDDLISRQAAIDDAHSQIWYRLNPNMKERIDTWLVNLPAVQSERKTGCWINDKHNIPRCSCCSYIPEYSVHINDYYYSDYCPNCGAKMKSEDRNEDSKM